MCQPALLERLARLGSLSGADVPQGGDKHHTKGVTFPKWDRAYAPRSATLETPGSS